MYNYASPVYIKLSNICTIVVCNNTEQRKIHFSRERDEKLKTVSSFIMIAIIIYVTKGGKIFFEIIKKFAVMSSHATLLNILRLSTL